MIRVLFVCSFLLFLGAGCKTISDYKSDYDACVADAACASRMASLKSTAQTITASAAVPAGVPMPLENILAQLFGMLASGLGGIMYGKKLRSVRSTDKS